MGLLQMETSNCLLMELAIEIQFFTLSPANTLIYRPSTSISARGMIVTSNLSVVRDAALAALFLLLF